MTYLGVIEIRKVLLFCSLFILLPGCGGFGGKPGPGQDPQIAALQRETRRVSRSNAATQDAVKELYNKIAAMETQLAQLDGRVEEIADREPILITPQGKPSAGDAAEEQKTTEKKKASPEPSKKHAPPEELPKKRADIQKTPSPPPPKEAEPAPPEPKTRKEYERAYSAYQDGRYDEALALFKAFLETHPNDDLSDNAQYWIGEIYYDIDNFPEAILAFKEVVTRYPQGNKAPHALLKIGYAYSALDNPANARTFLKRVIKNYPFSEAEAMAREKLKELENVAR